MPWKSVLEKDGFEAQRAVPPEVSKRQIEEEIPLTWKEDQMLLGYLRRYMIKGSGAGFVTPPYSSYWERLWGATPIEDLPTYKDLYTFTPYIKASIDVTVNMAIGNGFELQGSEDAIREWLGDWLDEHNILQTLRIVATDKLVFGNAYVEICRDEATSEVAWLKPLDPVHMRVRRDAFGNVFGYIQLLTFPPVAFEADDIVHFRYGAKSWWFECFPNGTLVRSNSLFKPIEDTKEGDTVLMHSGKYGSIEASKSFDYNGELVEITTYHNNIPLLATPTHSFFASIRKRGTKHKTYLEPAFVFANDLATKDYLLIPIDRKVVDKDFVEVEANNAGYGKTFKVDEDFMRLCGYYVADGSRRNEHSVCIVFDRDQKEYAEDAKAIAGRNGCNAFISEKKNKNCVSVSSTALVKFVEENFGRGATNKKIPEWVMFLPPEKQSGLIEGCIRGDGYRRRERYYIATTSENLAHQLYALLLRQNVIPSLSKRKTKNATLRDGRVIHSSPYIYLVNVYSRKDWTRGNGYAKGKIVGNYVYLPVKNIRKVAYSGKIWNLDVSNDETFTVGVGYAVHNSSYGTSLLRPLLKLQALIDQFQDDMATIVHVYTKPMLIVKAGTPERPFNDPQLQGLMEAFRDRQPATDVFVRGDVAVDIVQSMTKEVNIEWWLTYLQTQRSAVLGVPKIFLGESERTNRATAEIVMQEYVTRLRMLQELIGDTLETVLFKQLIKQKYGEGKEVPRIKWRPVWEAMIDVKAKYVGDLVDKGIILPSEARPQLGYPEQPPESGVQPGQALSPKQSASSALAVNQN